MTDPAASLPPEATLPQSILSGLMLPNAQQMQMHYAQQQQQFLMHSGLTPTVQAMQMQFPLPSTSQVVQIQQPGGVPLGHMHPQQNPPSASYVQPVQQAPASSSATPSAGPGPLRRRRFSTAKIQPTRIKKVMQSDEEIGRMVASVPVSIGRAMEHFAEQFLKAAAAATQLTNSRTLTPMHMKMAMLATPHFAFLEPILKDIAVPGRIGCASSPESDAQIMRLSMQLGYGQNQLTQSYSQPHHQQPQQQMGSPMVPLQMSPTTNPLTHYPYYNQQMVPQGGHDPNQIGQMGQIGMVAQQMAYQPVVDQGQSGFYGGELSHQNPPQAQAQIQSPTVPNQSVGEALGRKTAGKRTLSANGNGNEGTNPEGQEKPKRGRPRKVKKSDKCLDDELCDEVTNGIKKEDEDRELMPPPALPPFGRAKPIA
ncbi:hypothetical protein WR25_26757 [Diploscapter pachys]|uniref:Transcription factor CBF/NF-Y/archaeal histone domain-containing protein n=1 Tax=Diploscapter pachys TaxID=2018661 RepID=A0A2A2JMC4_9BILA|nr:hypothetical protein WR25_26757 [Diploscapter pachys]